MAIMRQTTTATFSRQMSRQLPPSIVSPPMANGELNIGVRRQRTVQVSPLCQESQLFCHPHSRITNSRKCHFKVCCRANYLTVPEG